MTALYNEIDPAAAHVLECLIKDKVIADGIVDRRSIAEVDPKDLAGFAQVHFFAGGGLWSVAARMAGWPDDRPLWTGSCPCQPFSVAGKGAGENDPRHLWPDFFRLIRACRPAVVMGEQVAGAAGYKWFDGVAADLEGEDYACRAVDIPACAVDAPHIRQRLYWCAVKDMDDATSARRGDAGCEPLGASWDEARRARSERRGGDGFDVADTARFAQREPHDDIRAFARQDTWLGAGGRRGRHAPGDMADADKPGLERRLSAAERAAEQPSGPDGVAGDMEHAARVGWGEGRAEHAVRSGRAASTGAGGSDGDMADAELPERRQIAKGWPHDNDGSNTGRQEASGGREFHCAANGSSWSDAIWLTGADGKARRAERRVRRVVARIPEGLLGLVLSGVGNIQKGEKVNGAPTQTGPSEALPPLRRAFGAQEIRRDTGGFGPVQGAQVLQPSLREHEGRSKSGLESPAGSQGVPQVVLRGVRDGREPSRASHRREYTEQQRVEYPDAVRVLSSTLALGNWQAIAEKEFGLQNLWSACAKAGYVPETLSEIPQIWKSMPDQTRERVGRILCARGLIWETVPLLSRGQVNRVAALRIMGNAIVPQVAAEGLAALMETQEIPR